MQELIIGVDLGGTQIRAALADGEGRILHRASCLTLAEEGPEPVIGRIKAAIREAVHSTDWAQVVGIGIGAPGPINPWTGVIHQAPNLPGWRDVPLRDIIQKEFQVPTHLGNDANIAALAEYRFGAGQGVDDLIYMTISTGIGGGVIAGGQLLLGADGLASEVGHMTLEPHGPLCNCGNIGCLEALASGPAIARDARQRIEEGAQTIIADRAGGDLRKVTAKAVGQAAQRGDELAIELIQRAGFYIGVGIVNLIHLFNPRLFVIGGGVSKAGDLLFDPIRATVRERAMPAMRQNVRVVSAALGDDVGLLGAVALALTMEA